MMQEKNKSSYEYETKPLLKTVALSKSFGGIQAIKNISLEFYKSEIVAILGDNGAGKSTYIKIITGAYTKDSGEIYWKGKLTNIDSPITARFLGIETIYQELALIKDLSATKNVFLGREIYKKGLLGLLGCLNKSKMKKKTKELVESLNVHLPSTETDVKFLSGGQRQALAIARAWQFEAEMIIMDEPTAALGVEESIRVLEVIKALRQKGVAVIIISHNLEHVFGVAQRIAVFKNGNLIGIRSIENTSKEDIINLIVRGKTT